MYIEIRDTKWSNQALVDLNSSFVPEVPAQVGTEYAYSQLYLYIQESPHEIRNPTHWILIGSATCVIAQQYSSAIFVSALRGNEMRPMPRLVS